MKWDDFEQEFKDANDKIKPSDKFKEQLDAMVKEETSSNVVPFYKNYKKMGAVAAALVVIVAGAGAYSIIGDFNSHNSSENKTVNSDVNVAADKSDNDDKTYHFEADDEQADTDVLKTFVGEYVQAGNADVTDGYMGITQSPDEVTIHFSEMDEYTTISDLVENDDGTLKVCGDELVFTLEHQDENVLMTVLESENEYLKEGDTVLFSQF